MARMNFGTVVRALIMVLSIGVCQGIKVLESTIKLGQNDIISGATLKDPVGNVSTEDLTICMRFNLKSLSGPDNRVNIITIGQFIPDPHVSLKGNILSAYGVYSS